MLIETSNDMVVLFLLSFFVKICIFHLQFHFSVLFDYRLRENRKTTYLLYSVAIVDHFLTIRIAACFYRHNRSLHLHPLTYETTDHNGLHLTECPPVQQPIVFFSFQRTICIGQYFRFETEPKRCVERKLEDNIDK